MDHFGHMLRSCGVIVVTWGTLGALGGRSWTTQGARRTLSSAKGNQGEPKIEISGVKRGQGGWRGNRSAACGEPLGEGGAEASPLVLGISSARPNHAKAWGGGFNRYAHSAGPCMGSQGDYYFN